MAEIKLSCREEYLVCGTRRAEGAVSADSVGGRGMDADG